MRNPRSGQETPPEEGPAPFSNGWAPDVERRQTAPRPIWLPSERVISAALVALIIIATIGFTNVGSSSRLASDRSATDQAGFRTMVVQGNPTQTPAGNVVVSANPSASGGQTTAEPAGATTPPTAAALLPSGPFQRDAQGNLFPTNRIVAYYGNPNDPKLGILGEDTMENVYAKLMDQVSEWETADPNTNVIPAFEIISTVAQSSAQTDGSWLIDLSFDTIQPYIDFATEHDMLVFLDIQIGKRGVAAEIERLMPLLTQPNVMLAIDPEFAIHSNEIPGENLGYITADEVNQAQQMMATIAQENTIPQKVVMVHQFTEDMIHDKQNVQDVPGVELVLHADGHGTPADKEFAYNVVITRWVDRISFWPGFKVFYNKGDARDASTDDPVMTPAEILQLDPVPYYISYQ